MGRMGNVKAGHRQGNCNGCYMSKEKTTAITGVLKLPDTE